MTYQIRQGEQLLGDRVQFKMELGKFKISHFNGHSTAATRRTNVGFKMDAERGGWLQLVLKYVQHMLRGVHKGCEG